jgi:hypothetical protein
MLYLASSVPSIFYMQYSNDVLITNTSFNMFKVFYLICNIISMIIFLINIWGLQLKSDVNDDYHVGEGLSYDPEMTRENSLIN